VAIEKNTKALINTNTEDGLEVEKFKYVLNFRQQNVGYNHDIKIASSSFKNVTEFTNLGKTVTIQNLIQV
jgi:hypothetical protein